MLRPLLLVVAVAQVASGAAALAAKKGKPPGRKPSAGRGFGAKPAPVAATSLADAVAKWSTRQPADPAVTACACGNGEAYATCCLPYHIGEKVAETPTKVLQTRYSAFAYRLPAHLIATTHPSNRDYREDKVAWARALNREGLFDGYAFCGLTYGAEEEGSSADERFLSFEVELREGADSGGGESMRFSETSRFLREGSSGAWLYASGDVRTGGGGEGELRLNS